MSSRCHAAQWHMSQCDQRTVIAFCRCVKPGGEGEGGEAVGWGQVPR